MSERCVCLHSKDRHELPGFQGECVAEGCRCTEYRPRHPASQSVTSTRPAPEPKPARIETVEQLVEAARETGDKRALLVIGRLQSMTAELHALVAAHRANQAAQAARERDAQYQAQLATLPKPPKATEPSPVQLPLVRSSYPCLDCFFIASSSAGLSAHRRARHKLTATVICPGCGEPKKESGLAIHRARFCSGVLTGSIAHSSGVLNLTGRNA